jgi:Bacterial toxin 44
VVTSSIGLKWRLGAGTSYTWDNNKTSSYNTTLQFDKSTTGEAILDANGNYNNQWFHIAGTNDWVSAAYISINGDPGRSVSGNNPVGGNNDISNNSNTGNFVNNLPGTLPINNVAEYAIYSSSKTNLWLGNVVHSTHLDTKNSSVVWADFANGSISYNTITQHTQLYGSASSLQIPYRQSVIDYMASEFSNNSISSEIKNLQILNAIPLPISKASAYIIFYNLVATGKLWDHKTPVKDRSNYQDWTIDSATGKTYKYESWSNMHYGYIGRLAGFTETELLNGAGLAQLKTTPNYDLTKAQNATLASIPFGLFDDPQDQDAIREGFKLYDKYKNGVSDEQFISYLRNNSALDTTYASPA